MNLSFFVLNCKSEYFIFNENKGKKKKKLYFIHPIKIFFFNIKDYLNLNINIYYNSLNSKIKYYYIVLNIIK